MEERNRLFRWQNGEDIGMKEILKYQYANGNYLSASSQPTDTDEYLIKSKLYTPHMSTRYINVHIGHNGMPMRRKGEILVDCEKKLPELYMQRENCCGCTACYTVCPAHAIVMRPDEEGFLYPIVNAEDCIRCGHCLKVCPLRV